MKTRTYLVLCLSLICLLLLQITLSLRISTALEASVFLIIASGFSVWILPGLLLGEYLSIESDDFSTTVSLSVAGSLVIGVLSIPILLIFHLKIAHWTAFLCLIQVGALAGLIGRYTKKGSFSFIDPLISVFTPKTEAEINSLAIFGLATLGMIFTYNVGENLFLLGNETAIHLQFTRFYHEFPFVLDELALVKGFPPANLIHFWEYQLAVWSRLSGMDPLIVFLKARCILPFIGFIALFFLVRNIFQSKTYRYGVYWGGTLLSLGLLNLQEPSSLSWIYNIDPSRFLTSYMGTVHHSDSGMEILLPLGCGLLLYSLRNMCGKIWCLLFGFLIACLLWHVREFLQLGIHFIVLSLVGLLVIKNLSKSLMLNWLAIVGAFLIISFGFLYSGSATYSEDNPMRGYPEMKIKEVTLGYMIEERNLLGFRSLFDFPFHIIPSVFASPDKIRTSDYIYSKLMNNTLNLHVDYWLVLCAISIFIIGLWGSNQGKSLARFFFLTWFLLFSWNSSMLFFIIATYSELLITIPRFLTTFSAILVATAACVIFEKLKITNTSRPLIVLFFLCLLCGGYGLHKVLAHWTVIVNGTVHPSWELILSSLVLSAAAWTGFLLSFIRTAEVEKRPSENRNLFLTAFFSVAGLFLFTAPALGNNYLRYFDKSSYHTSFTNGIYKDGNAYGLSEKLISYLRSLPVGSTFAPSDPTDSSLVTIYAPLRQLSNKANLVNMNYQTIWFQNKKHPIFNLNEIMARENKDLNEAHSEIVNLLSSWKSEYILLQDSNYQFLKWYFEAFPEKYSFTFHNEKEQELVIKIGNPLGPL